MLQSKKHRMLLLIIPLLLTMVIHSAGREPDTKVLTKSDLVTSANSTVSIKFTDYEEIRFNPPCGEALFVDFVVNNWDYVEAGDVIAHIKSKVSSVEIKDASLELQRAKEDLEDIEFDKAAAVAKAEDELKKMTGFKVEAYIKIAELDLESVKL